MGCISGGSLVFEAISCHLHLQSHQIRIHNSRDTEFYLTARSSPIIEHCTEMRFGRFVNSAEIGGKAALEYPGWESDAQENGLALTHENNMFGKVLDFNWHK